MDQIFQALHNAMPVLYVVTFLAVVLKIIIVINFKGFDALVIFMSFFRVYKRTQRESTGNRKRRAFMLYNNYINYYIYFFMALFLLMFIIFRSDMFSYS